VSKVDEFIDLWIEKLHEKLIFDEEENNESDTLDKNKYTNKKFKRFIF